jgi:hypothetical protein
MAWGAPAPSHVAVGAPADRFLRLLYNSHWSMQAQRERKVRIGDNATSRQGGIRCVVRV